MNKLLKTRVFNRPEHTDPRYSLNKKVLFIDGKEKYRVGYIYDYDEEKVDGNWEVYYILLSRNRKYRMKEWDIVRVIETEADLIPKDYEFAYAKQICKKNIKPKDNLTKAAFKIVLKGDKTVKPKVIGSAGLMVKTFYTEVNEKYYLQKKGNK